MSSIYVAKKYGLAKGHNQRKLTSRAFLPQTLRKAINRWCWLLPWLSHGDSNLNIISSVNIIMLRQVILIYDMWPCSTIGLKPTKLFLYKYQKVLDITQFRMIEGGKSDLWVKSKGGKSDLWVKRTNDNLLFVSHFFGLSAWLVGSQFLDQELNQGLILKQNPNH